MLNPKIEYTYIDIETTGLNPATDHITEIGAIKILGNNIVDVYDELVYTPKKINSRIYELTGINNSMVEYADGISSVLGSFSDWLGLEKRKLQFYFGYNSGFDKRFLEKAGLKIKIGDVLPIAKKNIKNKDSYSLYNLGNSLGFSLGNVQHNPV